MVVSAHGGSSHDAWMCAVSLCTHPQRKSACGLRHQNKMQAIRGVMWPSWALQYRPGIATCFHNPALHSGPRNRPVQTS